MLQSDEVDENDFDQYARWSAQSQQIVEVLPLPGVNKIGSD
jgi:hypothetical protein